ncbi:hypothetical protein ZWY2020_025882 [Hordeum vulgare]|nr:hypothetical protein ZWY2020_025882 [Hordeum vulgare]
MDPSTKLRYDSPLLRIYEDGRVERLFGTETTPPGFDADTGVTSKDVVINGATGVFARLYVPNLAAAGSDSQRKKLPILVYFHGGGLVLASAASDVPQHPIPAAYDDSWAALSWAASRDDPWLSEHGDAGRIFLAGDSGGANIVHNIAIMAGTRDGLRLPPGALLEGAIIFHPMFGGKEPVDGEVIHMRESAEKLWSILCPESTEGVDDPWFNLMAPGALSLQKLACWRLLVCSADGDFALPRAVAYYQAVKASGWRGTVEWLESKGGEHVFFLNKPECDEALQLMDRVVAFLAGN